MKGAFEFIAAAILGTFLSLLASGTFAAPALDAVLNAYRSPFVGGLTTIPYPVTRPGDFYTRTPSRPEVPRVNDFGVFSSVAIKTGALPIAGNWQKISDGDYTGMFEGDCTFGAKACESALGERFHKIAAKAAGMSTYDALQYVNATLNTAITYRDDSVGWGRKDYWANPAEIATRGFGDCEDYAIAKMWLLRAIGYSEDQLQLVVLKNRRSGIQHAVLAVHVNGARYVLDNMTQNIGKDDLFVSYSPIVSFVGDDSFIHGFASKPTNVAKTTAVGELSPASD